MFELNPNQSHSYGFFSHSYAFDDRAELIHRATRLFNLAMSRGRFARIKRWITRASGQLLDLNNLAVSNLRAQYYGGVRPVAIKKICGSLGRVNDFDCDFNPLDSRLRDRWRSIAMAYLHHIELQPVELIQVAERYFVLDGHHRISVAHTLGKCAIDAEVTVWSVLQSLPWNVYQYAEPQLQAV